MKKTNTEDDTKVIDYLTSSHAQQIGGRAGRYKTQYEDGEVTTFFQKDLQKLHSIVQTPKTPVEVCVFQLPYTSVWQSLTSLSTFV